MILKERMALLALALAMAACAMAQQAKYVFYFIGDGMGVNQVLGTEMFRAELNGTIGISPLGFTQFPHATVATTYSATNGVTDSAAGGTALATGRKAKNGAIGMAGDPQTAAISVAARAKADGRRVGIATSVSVDHATPAAFYAHNPSRSNYHDIGRELYEAGFDFYAGADFLKPYGKTGRQDHNLYNMASQYGYAIARGYDDYTGKKHEAAKMILLQTEEASAIDNTAITYAIDRKEGDLTLPDITRAAIDFMAKDTTRGFFIMVEGGKIDWACHNNDAATAFREVIDFDEAIRVAYEFYARHADETLIVVTADHETGGLALGNGGYDLNLKALANQRVSQTGFTLLINKLRAQHKNRVTWQMVRQALEENFGFWTALPLSTKQEARLKAVYDRSFAAGDVELEKSEYSQDEPIAAEATRIINEIARVGWTSGDHSAGYVPVFAIGVGADLFQGRIDNTDIAPKIIQAMGEEERKN